MWGMDRSMTEPSPAAAAEKTGRPMVRAELMGAHSHATANGVLVHVWRRDGRYLARGRLHGKAFGETLSKDASEAAARLRRLLGDIDDGIYLRPTEARQRPLPNGFVARLSLRDLVNEFLREKRSLRGQSTAGNYRARLMPALAYAEQPGMRQRWPLAMSIDHDFAIGLRSFLHADYKTTRNGRVGGQPKPLSSRQIYNILDCLRSMLAWARKPEVRKLPADWVNPLSEAIVGKPAKPDPLRNDKLPLHERIRLVEGMDVWQLCQLSLSLVLPLRPEEAAGLLVGDVNWQQGWLEFRTRQGGGDFTKGRVDFVLPFPRELHAVLRRCIAGRGEGPLLRRRAAFTASAPTVRSSDDLTNMYGDRLLRTPDAMTEQDRKRVFRRLLRDLGGVSPDELAKEFRQLLTVQQLTNNNIKLYTLRHAVSIALHRTPGMSHLTLRYLTGHSTEDIMSHYVGLDPRAAMDQYFATVYPLLDAIDAKAKSFGLD